MNQLPSLKVMTCLADVGFRNYIDLLIYKLLLNYKKYNQNLEIDTIQFQKRINKLCKEYSLSEMTAKRALKRLAKMGVVEIVYDLGFQKYVVKVKSLHDLLSQKGLLETPVPEEKSPEPPNSEKTEKSRVKQQQLIQAKQICQENKLNYRLQKDWWEIASHGIEKIKATIEIMYVRMGNPRAPIYNPCGWFKTALRDDYYLDKPDGIAEISMLERARNFINSRFVELVGCVPT